VGKMKLDGFGIFVKDMPAMVKFYRDVLGFEIKEDENTTNVFLKKDSTLFLLYRRTDFEKMTDTKFNYAENINGHYEVALSAENYKEVDKTYNEVILKGGKSVLPPTTEPWGQRTCYVADPEGNLIEIGSFVKE
jgi:lactoylglutathione lyase